MGASTLPEFGFLAEAKEVVTRAASREGSLQMQRYVVVFYKNIVVCVARSLSACLMMADSRVAGWSNDVSKPYRTDILFQTMVVLYNFPCVETHVFSILRRIRS